jgi:hypothetical protein
LRLGDDDEPKPKDPLEGLSLVLPTYVNWDGEDIFLFSFSFFAYNRSRFWLLGIWLVLRRRRFLWSSWINIRNVRLALSIFIVFVSFTSLILRCDQCTDWECGYGSGETWAKISPPPQPR